MTPLLAALLLTACGGGGGGSGSDPVTRNLASVAVDGRFQESLSLDFRSTSLILYGQGGLLGQSKTVSVEYATLNDDRYFYAAFRWPDSSHDNDFSLDTGPVEFDGIQLAFRSGGSSTIDIKGVIAAAASSQYVDQHRTVSDAPEDDLTGDGLGRLYYDAATRTYTAEFLIPHTNDPQSGDASLKNDAEWTLTLYESVVLATETGWVGERHNLNADRWFALDWQAVLPNQRERIPDDLTGLVVFISQHEHNNGDIYSFDPASGEVEQLTDSPAMKKDTLSLSHDRTRVAFMGTTTPQDFESFEIYVLDIASGNLTALTDNAVADGHPAWSEDDSRILYSSFRDAQGASLVEKTTAGVELADLTPFGFSDNDGEYLDDGRIIFKTNRFQAEPEVTLAVMNADGTGVSAVTSQQGVSDHDPVGNANAVLFERFNKDTYYFEDVDSGFVGWDIIEVALDSLEETALVADGWINWLPLYAPGGAPYILHLKGVGAYTDAQLISRSGQSLGRLIPGYTRMSYIDWK